MKKLVVGLGITIVVLLGIAGGCGWSVYNFSQKFLQNSLPPDGPSPVFRWCFNGLPFVDRLDSLLNNRTYLVILQNNRELRPSGGFMGSYAKISTQPSGLAGLEVQDIYVPDGQIAGHVDPPIPIQQAFGQGWWKLRDSNWEPDYPTAAVQIAWFFDQGKEPADGIVAVNLSLVNSLLEVLGEIEPLDYSEKVSAQTFYSLAQKYAEVGFFPGSTQKRDFLSAVGNALMRRIIVSSTVEKLKIAKVIWLQLKRGEIWLWFADANLQQMAAQRHWDGSLGETAGDYLYVVETNLGANKANCCVQRRVVQQISGENTLVTISFQNDNVFENPQPPHTWGGNYIDYLRLLIPETAKISSVKVADTLLVEQPFDNKYGLQTDRYQISKKGGLQTVGFWAVVPAQSQLQVEVAYSQQMASTLLVKHQPGVGPIPYKLVVNGQTITEQNLDRDTQLRLN